MSSPIPYALSVSVVVLSSLACGGLTAAPSATPPAGSEPPALPPPPATPPVQEPDAPDEVDPAELRDLASTWTGTPPLLMPVDTDGRCVVTDLANDRPIATFAGACDRWAVSANPRDPNDLLVSVGDAPPTRSGKVLPRLPEADSVDAVGFDTQGRVIGMTAVLADPTLDEAAETAFVTIDGKRVDMDYADASMFGIVACRIYTLDGAAWRMLGSPTALQLHEGMSSPSCVRVDGAPELAKLRQPGLDETMPLEHPTMDAVPDSLAALSTDDFTTWTWVGDDLAAKYMDFEGERLQAPFAAMVDGNWTVLEGLTKDEPAQMFTRDGLLLVCSDDAAHLYDTRTNHKRVWTAKGQCPVFWPLDG